LSSTTPYEKCRAFVADWGWSIGFKISDLVVPNHTLALQYCIQQLS